MKKVTLSTEALKPALKKLSLAVSSKPVIPALSSLYCKVYEKEVELITSDLELTIFYRVPAEAQQSFELLIPFDFLSKVVQLSGNQPLIIEHPSARTARIIAGGDIYEIKSLEKPADFPKIPELPKKNSFHLEASVLDRIRDSLSTAGKDELRPAMTRSCLDISEGMLTIVSTDAHMLYRYQVPQVTRAPDQLLISAKMAKALSGLVNADISWHSTNIAFQSENITLIATRHEDKYPDYRVVIPDHQPNLTIYRSDLISALEKVLLASEANCTLLLNKAPGAIHVTAKDEDFGRAVESSVDGRYTGKADLVVLNPEKLLTLLHQVEYEEIRLHIDTARRAVLLSSETDENYLGMIMPLVQ